MLRLSFPLLLLLFCICPAIAQLDSMPSPGHRCELPPAPFEGYYYAPPPAYAVPSDDRMPSMITVNFLSSGSVFGYPCSSWPASAQSAMNYAATLWENYLNPGNAIAINACWSTGLGGSTLGSAGATNYYLLSSGPDNTWYHVALAENVLNSNINGSSVEVQAVFNANRTDWYYGTDGNVAFNEIDFVTVAMHELGHGLGFSGGKNIDNGSGSAECQGIAGEGCYGFYTSFNGGNWYPDIYGKQMENNSGTLLTSISNPSTTVADLLLGQNGGLYSGSTAVVNTNGSPAKLYTPSTYASGSTFSHWDLSTFPSEMMKPQLSYGQAIHDPGLALNLFSDMGWTAAPLPVEWVSFTAQKEEAIITLEWETAAEINNAGFEVQHSKEGSNWETLDFVPAKGAGHYHYHDHYPQQGINYYRLLQLDFDGRSSTSETEVIYYEIKDITVGLYPNPASNILKIAYPSQSSNVSAFIFNAQGEKIMDITIQSIRQDINIEQLPTGVYWLKVEEQTAVAFTKI